MLERLEIEDLAIIEHLSLDFTPGLNVLSGETGAGKSIVVGALGLVLGARASGELVRMGAPQARVRARFRLPGDGILEVERIVPAQGKAQARIDGLRVNLRDLRTRMGPLVELAGQHDQRELLDPERHRSLLDEFGGLEPQLASMQAAWENLAASRTAFVRLERAALERTERADLLGFQLAELEDLGLELGEMEQLEVERKRLQHTVRLREGLRSTEAELYVDEGAAVERLGRAEALLASLASLDEQLTPLASTLSELSMRLDELVRDLQGHARALPSDPSRLDELEDRLAEARRLARKHRCLPEQLPSRLTELRAELDELANLETCTAQARLALAASEHRAREVAADLTRRRKLAAKQLDRLLNAQLRELAMARARFDTRVSPGTSMDGQGVDFVEFHLAANPGEPPRSIASAASGGELSRILLALKVGLRPTLAPTFVFDEVDTGIGGRTAEVVGSKLAQLARQTQVLCISHLPQIAGVADSHYVLAKSVRGGRTRSAVRRLDEDGRVQELARMIGGDAATEASQAYARELMSAWKAVA